MIRLYRQPALGASAIERVLQTGAHLNADIKHINTERCYYIQTSLPLQNSEFATLQWLLGETFEPENLGEVSFLKDATEILEVGPRPNFETAWSTTAVSICRACGLDVVKRIERSLRIGLDTTLDVNQREGLLASIHDRMTEMPYTTPLVSFDTGIVSASVKIIQICGRDDWREVLKRYSIEHGYGWDDQDIEMIGRLFREIIQRNPTDVELFQLAQANSEHSRHFFFKGQLIIDGDVKPHTLMDIIQAPWKANTRNSIIAFCDDSSAIAGSEVMYLTADRPGKPGLIVPMSLILNPTLTAETHNFPTGVAPYPGAETGTGGRIRDNFAIGCGGLVIVAGAAYCVGNLHIPNYDLPWEQDGWRHPPNLASPLDILIQASDGASDYGNRFGEPVTFGFARSCGLQLPDGYRSYFKPIMYTVGGGVIPETSRNPRVPERDMLVLQIGGSAYRIGVGGGAASSMIQGANQENLDFNAVQRGDAQMEQRLNRVIRGCIELGENNPIERMVDLGAGGSCNAIPEVADPAGARINLRALPIGDLTLSARELWGNESQERAAILIRPEHLGVVQKIAEREGVPCAVVGEVTGDGRLVVFDENDDTTPVDLPLEQILGSLPPKTFKFTSRVRDCKPLELPDSLSVTEALDRVLRLVSVGSKRFLTTKVDRSVTGLIAQQQCIGPNQLTLADCAVMASSYFDKFGTAMAIGEQPIKGLLSPEAAARMAVIEMLLNMSGARITDIEDIKCSANWMLAAKLDGEGAWLYYAACALRDICLELGIAIDGGKDSLSMAAQVTGPDGTEQVVKAPGELVITGYVTISDITRKVTADIKQRGSNLIHINLCPSEHRLGGSALAQVFGQLGDKCPDCKDIGLVKKTFNTIQQLIDNDLILSLHDISDGGLITALLEMAFAGNVGLDINLTGKCTPIEMLFNEEPGLVIETHNSEKMLQAMDKQGIYARTIGSVSDDYQIRIRHNDGEVLNADMLELRELWESTSTAIDALQANPDCVAEETTFNRNLVTLPPRHLSFEPVPTPSQLLHATNKPKVAILRSEGSNGDREMAAAFYSAGFEMWDVTMTDLLSGRITLDDFRGVAFVGGFSFADVLDAGKGWAGIIRFNPAVREQFEHFHDRPDTFSLGVCNGCQLMALMGWVPGLDIPENEHPRFIQNDSERFESRFSSIRITESPSIMLDGMTDSTLGIWVAHGEGKLHIPNASDLDCILDNGLAPMHFVDNVGKATETYPSNPNGSPLGITALCSPNGRHLAMMPHPERSFISWQLPWAPAKWDGLPASPWLRLFQNAYNWCTS